MLCLHNYGRSQAQKIMRKIALEFEELVREKNHPYDHRFSRGVVKVPPFSREIDLDGDIAVADEQMYYNKKTRRENMRAAI